MPILIDRLVYAKELCVGKQVLDIGGKKMPGCNTESPFAREYSKIQQASKEYRVVDVQNVPGVDYVINLNKRESISRLHQVFDNYRPEVILCMETLEHINYHYEVMNEMAYSVSKNHSIVFITVPNNGNWIFNALGWNQDHSIAFFKDVAERFVHRSDLGHHEIITHSCMQKYLWYWKIVFLSSFFQPFNWGFTIRPKL